MQFNFNKKLVLITGSTKGIGLDIAKRFLGYKAKVIITGREFLKKIVIRLKVKIIFFSKLTLKT